MNRGRSSALAAVIGAMLWAWIPVAAQGAAQFKARLSTVPVATADLARIQGSGSVTATLAGATLTLAGAFQGLVSPATVARVHIGGKGIPGAAVFDITVTRATSGSLSGTLRLSLSQVDDLRQGKMYVQLHSEQAPEGNLRGWLLQ
jgi:hypothetical protein